MGYLYTQNGSNLVHKEAFVGRRDNGADNIYLVSSPSGLVYKQSLGAVVSDYGAVWTRSSDKVVSQEISKGVRSWSGDTSKMSGSVFKDGVTRPKYIELVAGVSSGITGNSSVNVWVQCYVDAIAPAIGSLITKRRHYFYSSIDAVGDGAVALYWKDDMGTTQIPGAGPWDYLTNPLDIPLGITGYTWIGMQVGASLNVGALQGCLIRLWLHRIELTGDDNVPVWTCEFYDLDSVDVGGWNPNYWRVY